MFRRATATLLLTYLAWAGFGSVFASEHVHYERGGPLVHRHALDRHQHDHDHTNDSDGAVGEHVESAGPHSDKHASGPEFVVPPHLADSLLSHIGRAPVNSGGALLTAPTFVAIAWDRPSSSVSKPVTSYSMRIRDGTDHTRTLISILCQLPRPPPSH
jgi:hypothetical protein